VCPLLCEFCNLDTFAKIIVVLSLLYISVLARQVKTLTLRHQNNLIDLTAKINGIWNYGFYNTFVLLCTDCVLMVKVRCWRACVCKVKSAGVPEKLTSASVDCTAVEDEMSPSLVWAPESCSNESTSQAASQAKVEAVTLMLTVQPGITACTWQQQLEMCR